MITLHVCYEESEHFNSKTRKRARGNETMTMDVAKNIKEIRKRTLYHPVSVNLKCTGNNLLSVERHESPKMSVGNKGIVGC